MIETARPLRPCDLVPHVTPAAEGPADLELADRPALILDETDGVVLGVDRVDLGRAPAESPERPPVFADEIAPDLDAVAAHVDDRPAPRLLRVPEPGAVRPGMRLPRSCPQDAPHRSPPHRFEGPG